MQRVSLRAGGWHSRCSGGAIAPCATEVPGVPETSSRNSDSCLLRGGGAGPAVRCRGPATRRRRLLRRPRDGRPSVGRPSIGRLAVRRRVHRGETVPTGRITPIRGYYAPYYNYYYNPFFLGWGGYGFGYGIGFGYGYGYGAYGYGAYGYGYGPYPYGYPYPYYWGGVYDRTGAARIQVTPSQTQVFVDGYFVGTADKFDGSMQRLRVESGAHELEFYLEGYRTARQPVLFRQEGTVSIKLAMEAVGPGETSERPTPTVPPARDRQPQDPAGPPEGYRGYPADRMPPPDRTPPPQARGDRDDYGTLAIRVQPGDAEILIDGEHWDGSAGNRLSVQLVDGPHRVEIRREGFRPYTANVRVKRGQTETLNVSLTQ